MKLYPEKWQIKSASIPARLLERKVKVDFYFPLSIPYGTRVELLLFNDGQILEEIQFIQILQKWSQKNKNAPLFLVAAVHAGKNRLSEYGTAGVLNDKSQGSKAAQYQDFILNDLTQYIAEVFPFSDLDRMSFAGFSLGGLTALDIAWSHPERFGKVGVFSGSFWWRTLPAGGSAYSDLDRIMHRRIREGSYHSHLRFFFECGTGDETNDRNNNGVIDAIDDTVDLMRELQRLGYQPGQDIQYLEVTNGEHNPQTWAKCLPAFLDWGWGK